MKYLVMGLVLSCLLGCSGEMNSSGEYKRDAWHETDLLAETQREIERLQAQPVALGNVKIKITRLETQERKKSLHQLFLQYRDQKTKISMGHLGGRNGLYLYGLTPHWAAGWQSSNKNQRQVRKTEQFVVAMPGTKASISCTETRNVPWLVTIPVWYGTEVEMVIEEEITGSGFTVGVLSAKANRVEIELTPYFDAVRRRGRIEVTELQTRMALKPGTPYVIGGNNSRNQTLGGTFFGRWKQSEVLESVIVLEVEVGM